jgi:hypothetical protein
VWDRLSSRFVVSAEVVLELRSTGAWHRVGSVGEAEPPGSFSAEVGGRREVYVFGWLADGSGPGVWRSTSGVDLESPAFRAVLSAGLELIADLDGGACDLPWRDGVTVRLRRGRQRGHCSQQA